jgi:hypothetical protein
MRCHPKERARRALDLSKYERLLRRLWEIPAGKRDILRFFTKILEKEVRAAI